MALQLFGKSILAKAKLGMGGPVGIIVGTAVIDVGSKIIRDYIAKTGQAPQLVDIADRTVIRNLPLHGDVNIRDLGGFAFTFKEIFKLVKGGKPNLMNIALNVITKSVTKNQTLVSP